MKKIFSPFIKLWNWIKETAWIQPLLIVGIVFGIIFSISPIVKACSTENTDEEYNFYVNREKSLEKIFKDYANCDAANLLTDIQNAYETFEKSGYEADATKDAIAKLPAEKFFLMFYSKECEACKNSSDAFEYLVENWGTGYFKTNKEDTTAKQQDFNMYTINTLTEVKNDEDKDEVAFPELLENIPEFFESAGAEVRNSPYYINGKIDSTNLTNFSDANQDAFTVPALLLIDFTSANSRGYEQLTFTLPGKNGGTGAADKAMTLMDCWNGTEDFGLKN
jgi:thiol-disulfide isomerase/thioredoxin